MFLFVRLTAHNKINSILKDRSEIEKDIEREEREKKEKGRERKEKGEKTEKEEKR